MRWQGIVDFSASAGSTTTNTSGNVRNIIVHKGSTFPSGTSIPQAGQIFYYNGTSTQSTPSNQMFYYNGSSWGLMGGGGVQTGTESPDLFPTSPTFGNLWYATDTNKLYCYTGISGYSGNNSKGWFNLMNAVYGA